MLSSATELNTTVRLTRWEATSISTRLRIRASRAATWPSGARCSCEAFPGSATDAACVSPCSVYTFTRWSRSAATAMRPRATSTTWSVG